MNAAEFVAKVVLALEELQLPYMVVGSFSSNAYGNPRSTKDADFVVEFGQTAIDRLIAKVGDEFRLESQMSFETVTSTMRHRLFHRSTSFTVEIFLLSDDEHDRVRFERRVPGNIGGGKSAIMPTAEDVVITKLRWSRQGRRQKDIIDARNVIGVQGNKLDLNYLRHWCDIHGTRDLLEQALGDTARFREPMQ